LDRNGSDLLLAKQSLTLENEQLTRRAQLLEQDLSSLRSATTSTSQSIPVCPGHLETIDRLESEARGNKMKITNLEVSCSPVSLLSSRLLTVFFSPLWLSPSSPTPFSLLYQSPGPWNKPFAVRFRL
jgi:hypothetical protein